LELELAGQVAAGELPVFAHVASSDPVDPSGREEDAEAPAVHAAVVRDHTEAVRALLEERRDQHVRHSAEPEAADRERGAVPDVRYGLGRGGHRLVHVVSRSSDELKFTTLAPSVLPVTALVNAVVRQANGRRRLECGK